MSGCGLAEVETHEAQDPALFLWRRLVPNSGGPGQFRGGQSLDQAYAIHYSDGMAGPGFNACAEVPPQGFGGGFPASGGDWHPVRSTNISELLEQGVLPTRERLQGEHERARSKVTHLVLGRDDVFVATSGGGGGLGDPLLRDPNAVLADVRAGYVTPGHAREVYGVIIDGEELDAGATSARREEIRAARIGREPEAELRSPADPGVAVLREDGEWKCGSCGHGLGSADQNWRGNAVLVEEPIVDHYASTEMYVRSRDEDPAVMLRQHFCGACAASLAVDVATAGLEPLPAPSQAAAALA
jgi:N-methylhydantoinase B